jgi:hypothetical protein
MARLNEPIVFTTSVPKFHIPRITVLRPTVILMSASTVDNTAEHVLYAERPEWSDLTPIPQYENIQPLAPIFYNPECMQHSSHPLFCVLINL